jgi:hypothetical protein
MLTYFQCRLCISYTLLPYFNKYYIFFIHHFRFLNTCCIFFDTLFLYFLDILRIFYKFILSNFFKYIFYIFYKYILHIFYKYILRIFNTYCTICKVKQLHLACDVRAWRKRGPWSRLEKYVHSMQYAVNHRVSMYADFN